MPQAPRLKGKAQNIAWDILGKPANLAIKKTAKQKEIDHRLLFQYAFRAR